MKWYKLDGFTRISKKNAERRYNNGEIIYLCPHALRPGYPWHPEVAVAKTDFSQDAGVQYFISNTRDFGKLVEEFTYYNCSHSTGKYPAYYIKG